MADAERNVNRRKPYGYWNANTCSVEALKYSSKMEFKEKSSSAYSIANKNHWLNDMCKHMRQIRKPNGYWNKERCQEEALKYKTIKEYRGKSYPSYVAAKENKWSGEICSHMIKIGNRYNKCIYSYGFPDKSVYVGLTYDIDNRQMRRNSDCRDQVIKHINKTGFAPVRKQLTQYINVDDAIILEGRYVEKYKSLGWNVLNINKTGSIGGNIVKWTYEKCKKVALKYKSRRKFKLAYPGAYTAAYSKKWINKICLHMKKIYKPNGYWTYENCKREARKYKSSYHFKSECQYAWNVARKNNWIMSYK